jgi:FkbM family methyltransferase
MREALQWAETGLGQWLRRELSPGAVAFDIGANIGGYTELAANIVGPSGHVYAFEPGPDNLEHLRARVREMSQVTVVEAAVGDGPGTVTFFLDRRDGTRHSLAPGNVGKKGEAVTVRQVSLDDYGSGLTRLDVLKIDAQGAELKILRGAQRLLSTFGPRITLEMWPFGLQNCGGDAAALLAELGSLGYTVFRLSAKGQLKPESHVRDFLASTQRWNSINVVALPHR